MALNPWVVSQDILFLIDQIKTKNHHPRLEQASIVACFDDSKPFIKNKINLGKVTKFSPFSKLWQREKHDFCFLISSSLWADVLKVEQQQAYLDLLLTRCDVEYEPQIIEENGKKIKVKDEWGRIQFTDKIRYDDEGNPKWKISSLDLDVCSKNIKRCGLWLDTFEDFKQVVLESGKINVNQPILTIAPPQEILVTEII